jgi:hypothetical protein
MTNMKIIDAGEADGLIRREVDRMGEDWRYLDHYVSCSYNPTNMERNVNQRDEPFTPTGDHCIVGGIIEEALGIRMVTPDGEEIAGTWDERRARQVEDASRAQGRPVRFTPEANAVLRMAQVVQDDGGTHGLAGRVASELYIMILTRELTAPAGEE